MKDVEGCLSYPCTGTKLGRSCMTLFAWVSHGCIWFSSSHQLCTLPLLTIQKSLHRHKVFCFNQINGGMNGVDICPVLFKHLFVINIWTNTISYSIRCWTCLFRSFVLYFSRCNLDNVKGLWYSTFTSSHRDTFFQPTNINLHIHCLTLPLSCGLMSPSCQDQHLRLQLPESGHCMSSFYDIWILVDTPTCPRCVEQVFSAVSTNKRPRRDCFRTTLPVSLVYSIS